MFSNPVRPSRSKDEGTVMQVDLQRRVCKVITTNGQKLDNVQLSGSYGGNDRHGDWFTPRFGDKVLVDFSMGYPILERSLSRLQGGSQSYPHTLGSGVALDDTGNYAPGQPSITSDSNKPIDMLIGDRIIGSLGGGVVALLRSGTAILRSSRAAEVFTSRLGSLVRIVSRNFEHFTDVGSDVVRNYKGRVYRYFGVSNTFSEAKVEEYRYHEYYGDVAAAEAVKTNYASYSGTIPDKSDTLFKEQVTDSSGVEVLHRTISSTGVVETYSVVGGVYTKVTQSNGSITLTFGDQQVVVVDGSSIRLTHSSGATTTLDSNGVSSSFSGHYVNITSSGVQLG